MDEEIQTVVQKALAASAEAHLATDKVREEQMAVIIARELRKTFSIEDGEGQKRFLDVTRVPLICQSIVGIHASLKDIKENMVSKDTFWPIKTLVYGAVGIILIAVMSALVYLVILK